MPELFLRFSFLEDCLGSKACESFLESLAHSLRDHITVARKVASTEGVIGKSSTACRAASIRIRLRAMFAVIVNAGLNGISAVCRQRRLPLRTSSRSAVRRARSKKPAASTRYMGWRVTSG